MDMATLMSMFGGGQGGQPVMQAGQQPSTQPGGMGFGLGQQMMQPGQAGQGMQYAPQTGQADTGMMAQLQQMFAGQGGAQGAQGQGGMASALGPMAQMMAQQQQQGQQGQMPQMNAQMMNRMGPQAGGQTQASRGYLAQGGGIQPRRIIGQ